MKSKIIKLIGLITLILLGVFAICNYAYQTEKKEEVEDLENCLNEEEVSAYIKDNLYLYMKTIDVIDILGEEYIESGFGALIYTYVINSAMKVDLIFNSENRLLQAYITKNGKSSEIELPFSDFIVYKNSDIKNLLDEMLNEYDYKYAVENNYVFVYAKLSPISKIKILANTGKNEYMDLDYLNPYSNSIIMKEFIFSNSDFSFKIVQYKNDYIIIIKVINSNNELIKVYDDKGELLKFADTKLIYWFRSIDCGIKDYQINIIINGDQTYLVKMDEIMY